METVGEAKRGGRGREREMRLHYMAYGSHYARCFVLRGRRGIQHLQASAIMLTCCGYQINAAGVTKKQKLNFCNKIYHIRTRSSCDVMLPQLIT